MRVLVLDSTWQPARIIGLRRAVTLLASGKAIPVSDIHVGIMRSPSTSIEVPAVIQVSTLIKNGMRSMRPPECTRARVLTRDDHVCQFVINGEPCMSKADTIDHLIPQSRGGDNSWENLVGACFKHNGFKDNNSLEEMTSAYNWTLKSQPYAPKFMIRNLARDEIHPEWHYFLSMLPS